MAGLGDSMHTDPIFAQFVLQSIALPLVAEQQQARGATQFQKAWHIDHGEFQKAFYSFDMRKLA